MVKAQLVESNESGSGRATYDRTNISAQSYTHNRLGDRLRVDKPTGTRLFVYDAPFSFGAE